MKHTPLANVQEKTHADYSIQIRERYVHIVIKGNLVVGIVL